VQTKRTLSSLLIAGGLACSMLFAACGSSASSTDAATSDTATSTPAAQAVSTTDYTNSDGTYSLKYPAAWTAKALSVSDAPGASMFLSQDGKDVVLTEPLSSQVAASDYASLANTFLTGANATQIQIDPTTNSMSLASGTWTGLQGTAMFAGTDSVITELVQDHNDKSFMVVTIAPKETDSSDGNTYFQPLVASITFLK
jgi:hypothetical protein